VSVDDDNDVLLLKYKSAVELRFKNLSFHTVCSELQDVSDWSLFVTVVLRIWCALFLPKYSNY